MIRILAIETSCDDTSASVVENDRVISNILSSQVEFHKEWGGVVPSLAKRLHQEKIGIVVGKALKNAHVNIKEINYIAVTYGPGLAIALGAGIDKAKELSREYNIPLIPVNHMTGHIYSSLAKNSKGEGNIETFKFPYMALLTSGGHTEIVIMKDHGLYEKIGETLDDAIGEAFDKVGRMLGLGYPAGPVVAKLAEKGDPYKYELPIAMKGSKDLNFSYSGLKTASQLLIDKQKTNNKFNEQTISDISAVFQRVAIEQIILKIRKALEQYEVNGLILGGGVSANIHLRKRLRQVIKPFKIKLYAPLTKKLCTDNAGMIGIAGYWMLKNNVEFEKDINKIERTPDLSF